MGLYNFKERFAPRIKLWAENPEHPDAKAHTIRAPRKGGREDKPGDTMYLYTGLRHKGAARIIEPVVCARAESVVIRGNPHWPYEQRVSSVDLAHEAEIFVGPFLENVLDDTKMQKAVISRPAFYGLERLDVNEREQLARRDGFDADKDGWHWPVMIAFWSGKLPWYGHIFHWRRA